MARPSDRRTRSFLQIGFVAVAVLLSGLQGLWAQGFMRDEGFTEAHVEQGDLQGKFEDGVAVFQGIPYAEPPIGDLRWRTPRPPLHWSGSREAFDFGPACPQAVSKEISWRDMDEDCLTLNIWTPARTPNDKLAVMVWVHGGGFNSGSARQKIYNGANLSHKDVVIVTLNYRLGYFGFFGHPELTEEAKAEHVATANYGLFDQLAAFEWVQRNIASFGGDPSNVTVFGESAGAVSILALMTTPSARGLFQKAIVQSGGGRWVAPGLTNSTSSFLSAYDFGDRAARSFGLDPQHSLKALRDKSWRDIMRALSSIHDLDNQAPFLDGTLLTEQMEQVFERGGQLSVPIIIGANSYEGVLLRKGFKVQTNHVLNAVGPQLDDFAALYPRQLVMTDDALADHIWGDAAFLEPARMMARLNSRAGAPVYHYVFDFQPPLLRLLGGSPHGLEVAYAFGNLKRVVPFPFAQLMHPNNYAVSRFMVSFWTNFAKTGDPNAERDLYWPKFTEANEQTLVFGPEGSTIERDYLKARLDLFKGPIW